MSSSKPAAKTWDAMVSGQRLRMFLIQVYITYHRELRSGYSAREVGSVSNLVENGFNAFAELQGGRVHSWDDRGGLFLFLTEDDDSFDNGCLAAVQMLEMMPAINEDVRLSADVVYPVDVSIMCDTGLMTFARDPSEAAGPVVDDLIKHRRALGAKGCVTITERVYRQLTRPSKLRFTALAYSSELDVDLHSTPPLRDDPGGDGPPARREVEDAERGVSETVDPERRAGRGKAAGRSPRGPASRAGRWAKAVAALVGVFLAGLAIGRALMPPARPAAPAAPAAAADRAPDPDPAWGEPFSSAEWLAWRKHAHELLSGAKLTEKTLIEAVRGMPSAKLDSPAASLRRDQEIGEVLLSYERVRNLLYDRFGIGPHFLGTGLSNPVAAEGYGKASVHEYLIPNKREESPQVWTRRLRSFPADLDKTVRGLIEDDKLSDPEKPGLRQSILTLAREKDGGTGLRPVIRFARLNEVKYSGRLGPGNRACVFASDLAEVWDLKIKDAAARSGYPYDSGDTFFVWVFVPGYPDEVIPATWDQVLKNVPRWLKPYEDQAP